MLLLLPPMTRPTGRDITNSPSGGLYHPQRIQDSRFASPKLITPAVFDVFPTD
jgi:hypothetical protein